MRYLVLLGIFMPLLMAAVWAQNPGYAKDPNWVVPPRAAAEKNPLADRPETAAGGRKLFMRNCTECHGKDGSGIAEKHSADLLLPVVQSQSDGALFWRITNGNADEGMPSFSRLPQLQRWQLVMFIRTLKSSER